MGYRISGDFGGQKSKIEDVLRRGFWRWIKTEMGNLQHSVEFFPYSFFNSSVIFFLLLLLLLSTAFYGPAGMASLVLCDQLGSIMRDAGDDVEVDEGMVPPTKSIFEFLLRHGCAI